MTNSADCADRNTRIGGIRFEAPPYVLRRTGERTGSASGRRLETETVIAEILLQLLDPPLNEGSGVVRAGNIDRLAVATEPKHRVACVRAHLAEHPLHRCEVPVRRETDRLRPRGKIAQQLAAVARIDGN